MVSKDILSYTLPPYWPYLSGSAILLAASGFFIIEFPEARFPGASEEPAHVDVSRCEARPQIGDRVRVIPVHPCPTFNEHDLIAAVLGDRVEAFWPVHARGAIR